MQEVKNKQLFGVEYQVRPSFERGCQGKIVPTHWTRGQVSSSQVMPGKGSREGLGNFMEKKSKERICLTCRVQEVGY